MCAARPTVSWLCNHPTRSRQVSVTVALFRRRSDRSTIKARAPLGRSLHRELFSKVREGAVLVCCVLYVHNTKSKEPVNAKNTPIGDCVWMTCGLHPSRPPLCRRECQFLVVFCLFRKPSERGAKCDSNLVDSASSHTLVSKIKPCMSKYKRIYTVKLRTAH